MKIRIFFLLLLLTTFGAAQPAGTYWIGESEGDDFDHILQVGESSFIARVAEDGTWDSEQPVQLQKLGENFYSLRGEDDMYAYLRFRGDNEALMWITGETRLYWLLKVEPQIGLPLEGEWKVLAGKEIFSAKVGKGKLTFLRDSGEKAEIAISTVSPEHGESRVVAHPMDGDSYLLYFVPIDDDLWLVRNHDEDTSLFLFRGDTWAKRMSQEAEKRAEASQSSSEEAAPATEE